MSDEFQFTIPVVRGEGVGVPIGEIQRAINTICQQSSIFLNEITSGGYPQTNVNITGGTINGTPVGAIAPSTGNFTSLASTSYNLNGVEDIEDIGRTGNSNTPTVNVNISEALNYTASYVTHYGMLVNAVQTAGGTGDRIGFGAIQTTNATLAGKSCVGISGLAVAAGTALGNYTGINAVTIIPAGLTGPSGAAVAFEADVETHSPVSIKNGIRISDQNNTGGTTTHGTLEDAAIAIVNETLNAAQGFRVGIQFGENPQGYPLSWPILSGGTLLQASNPNVSLAYGFDLSGATAGFSVQALALPQNTTGGGIQWGTAGTAGKVLSTATTSGNTVQFTDNGLNVNSAGASGVNTTFNSASTNTVAGVQIVDTTTLAQSQLMISATANTGDGAGIKLVGNGATTPSKTIRVNNGTLQVVNDAYSNIPLQLTDSGNLSVIGSITPAQTAGIVGTTTNNNANAGSVGEFPTPTNLSAVALTLNTPANVSSVSLTAGDWDVTGVVSFTPAAGTSMNAVVSGPSTTSATIGGPGTFAAISGTLGTALGQSLPAPVVRMSLAATTTVFLIAQATFSGGTCTASGFLRARRIR